MQPVDLIIIIGMFCGLWGLAEIHNVLKKILWELNPKKKPVKAAKRKRPFRVFRG